ncbi:MAG: hypothetical protein U1D30_09385 [Planctomycetota bacterium]
MTSSFPVGTSPEGRILPVMLSVGMTAAIASARGRKKCVNAAE